MNINEFSLMNATRADAWHKGQQWSTSDWAVALAGEVGEACNIIKKMNRERDNLLGNKDSDVKLEWALAMELADIFIYLDLLATHCSIDLANAIRTKFNATSEKFGFEERI
jgi:NTP pyrophosphatase (non-canonical NTP hydrolase)